MSDTIVAALREAFPHFQDDTEITPEAIRGIGREYLEMTMGWEPSRGEIEFTDEAGNVRKLIWEEGDDGVGIRPGWALEDGFLILPAEPSETMWGELARDIVMWTRFRDHTGADLYKHLRSIGRAIPTWLLKEIPDTNTVPPKGTVAAVIYKAMCEAAN